MTSKQSCEIAGCFLETLNQLASYEHHLFSYSAEEQ